MGSQPNLCCFTKYPKLMNVYHKLFSIKKTLEVFKTPTFFLSTFSNIVRVPMGVQSCGTYPIQFLWNPRS